jgi:2-polyprenyl-6-methoxyphenol hydroxylase-like FAD-dependent oxidoreductase
MRILIAGGGIGGLVLALMLHEAGIACTVLEAAQDVRPLGVGINLLPHAVRELQSLHLLPALDCAGIRTRRLTYANHRGQEIWSEPRGLHAGHDAPQFSIHRGRLQTLLWTAAHDRLGPDALRPGHRLIGVAQDAGGVTAHFMRSNGSTATLEGDALVGADGIHSWLRTHLHPDQPGLRWNGISMWRGATDWAAYDGGDAMVVAGDTTVKLVLYPIGPGTTPANRLTNWVIYARVADPQTPTPDRQNWSRPGRYEEFRHLADRLSLPCIDIAALIRATRDIYEYPMCDRDPLPWWTQGRLTLLGDAAHPMYPVGSNGASQAIVDARCLTAALLAQRVPEALRAYAAQRLPATVAVVQSNRSGGPERVIDLAAARAPDGFGHIHDIATAAELADIAQGYARLAGFAVSPGSSDEAGQFRT